MAQLVHLLHQKYHFQTCEDVRLNNNTKAVRYDRHIIMIFPRVTGNMSVICHATEMCSYLLRISPYAKIIVLAFTGYSEQIKIWVWTKKACKEEYKKDKIYN